ncbi:hypothetical protein V7S43_013844 [Phytophthora oleae]|uniref:Uncharacterized protein n=1 Tax=Phytophthora oleae TaxID=2107226 RepID=A0ABD3F5D9_9STRA
MNFRKGNALLQALDIPLLAHSVQFPIRNQDPANVDSTVEAFKWENILDENGQKIVLLEEQQRQRYLKYVEDNISDVFLTEKLCVVAVEKDNNILSVALPGYGIELVGSTDLLIMSDLVKEFPQYMNRLTGVRMLIEVKSDAKTKDAVYQALSELTALGILANDLVVAMVTNLTDYWELFWFSNKSGGRIKIK